jgi:hypothetical protein
MPKTNLASVPTEALVAEIKRRFAAIDRAKAELFEGNGIFSPARKSRESIPGKRKRGGTSEYARQVSTLVQKIRHAKGRGENVSALEKRLNRIRAQHKRT